MAAMTKEEKASFYKALNEGVVTNEAVHHPAHYAAHPSGVECITIVECFNFNLGNAIKYIWRADSKGKELEDLKKAAWYVNREIERLQQ